MTDALTSATRARLAIGGIALAAVLFVAFNILTERTITRARLDLTEQRLFSLTDGTRQVLAEIDEPLSLRLYVSRELVDANPYYANYAQRVTELLREYERLAEGGIELEIYDPEPYSPEEDQAVAEGLQGAALGAGSAVVYFGLTGFNATDDRDVIAFFQPERANFLEYDLTRLVHNLANPEKPRIAVMGALPLQGGPLTRYRPWLATTTLQPLFDISFPPADSATIDPEVGVLLLAQPEGLSEAALYAIDQFVLRGGRVLALIDPWSEAQAEANPGRPYVSTAISDMAPLLKAWGIEIDPTTIVGDRLAARKVAVRSRGRQVVTEYVAWLGLGPENMAGQDAVTAQLKVLNLNAAGSIRPLEGASTTFEPMITSSDQSLDIEVTAIQGSPDPTALLARFIGPGEPRVLAARVTGQVTTAFPDGPPQSVLDTAEDAEALKRDHRSESEGAASLIVVADADLLVDSVWSRADNLFGQRLALPIANNMDFIGNALDNLSGSEGLIGLRGRLLADRPLKLIQDMQRDAELRYRAREQAIVERIETAEQEIDRLQREEAAGGALLDEQQQQALDKLVADLIQARRELREVQRALRQDILAVESWVKALNIWAMPIALALVAGGLALLRRRRARRDGSAVAATLEAP